MTSPKSIAIRTVDAFTRTHFKGNPAAVVLTKEPLDDEIMKSIAREMNLPQTAFAQPVTDCTFSQAHKWNLRWLAPIREMDLCGHATLATAHTIFTLEQNVNAKLEFVTRSGALFVEKVQEDKYAMDFPALDVVSLNEHPQWRAEVPQYVYELAKIAAGALPIECVCVSSNCRALIVVVKESVTIDQMLSHTPDFGAMEKVGNGTPIDNMCALTKRCDPHNDNCHFASRAFAPWVGNNEDPACGSMHCCLLPYWTRVWGKKQLLARQLFKNRGGEFDLTLSEDGTRVKLIGTAVHIIDGVMRIS